MGEVLTIKIVFIFSILISSAITGFLPMIFPAFHSNKNFLSYGNCFAAGIFIIVGLAGLLPDAQESFDESMSKSMPISFVLATVGYMVIFFVENILFDHHHDSHNHLPSFDFNDDPLVNSENEFPKRKASEITPRTFVPAVILTAALVVHSTFEGIAVGLLSSKSSVVTLSVAILIHNMPAAIALGIKMQGLKRWAYCTLMGIFVCTSPLSIMIGIFLSDLGLPALQGTFLSISAGTFLYIGCSEILPEEMEKHNNKFIKFAALALGCVPLGIFLLFVTE